jgi:hypothetical protein
MWIAVLLGVGYGGVVQAQTATQTRGPVAVSKLDVTSTPYHITWDGGTGVFQRDALGNLTPLQMKMTFLHTDPGPRGYAKYLAWFIARDTDSFVLLWCYLNDSGRDFYTWMYSYPNNLLTSLHFSGKYTFVPPAEPTPSAPDAAFTAHSVPNYAGPDFAYRDWTRVGGTLGKLDLRPVASDRSAAASASGVVKSITQITAMPLQEIHVASGNGWRTAGWRELHCLAQDAAGDPYYLILYNNTTQGFVVDLKRAQTYVSDFGQAVMFQTERTVYGQAEDRVTGPPELRIGRYTRQEITLTASAPHANPYAEAEVVADFRGPGGQEVTVPGFWDGDTSWIVRFTPASDGPWTWRTRSKDPGLDGQQGGFTCVAESDAARGFMQVSATNARRFSYSDGTPFLPVSVKYPIGRSAGAGSGSTVAAGSTDLDPVFAQDVDALALMGFDRLLGGWLVSAPNARNEGGALFVEGDPNRINPAYFQALDRRIAYLNSKGIVPDLGIGTLNADLYSHLNDTQMQRLWHYVVARYSAYNVCWNLFDREIGARVPDSALRTVAALVAMTRADDPMHHPITTVVAGSATPTPPDVLVPAQAADQNVSQFVQSPAGMKLWPDASGAMVQQLAAVELAETTTPSTDVAGLDIITLNGGDLQEITADNNYVRPVVIYDRSTPPSAEAARHRIWETWLRGGVWARDSGEAPAAQKPGAGAWSDDVLWASYCGKLFASTRHWRLASHNELLHTAGAAGTSTHPAMAQRPPTPGPSVVGFRSTTPAGGDAPTGVFLLADPAWEYVAYLEHGGAISLDLLEATGEIEVTWFNPRTGDTLPTDRVMGGALRSFHAPDTNDWVLHLSRR